MTEQLAVPKSVFEAFRAEWLPLAPALRGGGFTPLPHDHVLAARLALAFEEGVARLEPHPDDDPRWRRTLARHLERGTPETLVNILVMLRLEACPDDDVLRWLSIACTAYYCDNDFAADLFKKLVVREPANLRWLIATAAWVRQLSGVDTAERLREELLLLQDLIPTIPGLLRGFRASDDAHTRWIGDVGEHICRGHNFSLPGSGETPSWARPPAR